MQNIHEILKAYGLEIPSDKKAEFDKAVIENYKTVAEVEKISDKLEKASNDLITQKETVTTLTGELQALKDNNATAEDWKAKFETLQADISEKEQAAKEEKEKAEREANILSRYNAVCTDKDGKPL